MLSSILNFIFYVFLLVCVLRLIFYILDNYLLSRDFEWNTGNGKYWAVVTGSSDGIGYEMARQLALKGYNIMMISRSEDKLQQKKQLILKEVGESIQIRTLAVDFQYLDIYEKIEKFLDVKNNDIFILVNNVGFAFPQGSYTENLDGSQKLIMVNVMSTVKMTDLILPSMLSKKRGLILNVSSQAAEIISDRYTLYCATKAFVTSFSRSLHCGYADQNVLVFDLRPGMVSTNLVPIKPSFHIPTAQAFVESSLKKVSWTKPESHGYWVHSIQLYIYYILFALFDWRRTNSILSPFYSLQKKLLENNRR